MLFVLYNGFKDDEMKNRCTLRLHTTITSLPFLEYRYEYPGYTQRRAFSNSGEDSLTFGPNNS
ncbi:hypothetical protein [Desulfatitalea alkaliphila]|uniref:Uncharacterized protein n=1 Tax=Desulfatitalea alkaliphila TaxID=2929485 RepID=A0AA41R349_9BACT|nr:hypothetical protein [Desulfatitalea alkaliphila]MCJ8499856.1 hypothetical protein [Desulfatitalea alkaliphila]